MLLIIGLGNPGKEYEKTRHNAGFILVDKIGKNYNFPDFEFNKKFNAEISKGQLENREILLAKPRTFMNKSGEAVNAILDFYKISPENIIVVHDDIDIELGKYKIALDSRSAGHNGVQDIMDKLGTQKFKRIRIGIKPEEKIYDASDFVLQKFGKEEWEKLDKTLDKILKEI